jgi:predicted DNA-binding transcriptional regulator AlpA
MTTVETAAQADRYLALKDLAAYSGLSVRTLRSYLSHRVTPMPAYQIAGKILVRRSEFDAWMARFRRTREMAGEAPDINAIVNDIVGTLTLGRTRADNRAGAMRER